MSESHAELKRKINRSLRSETDFMEAESYSQRLAHCYDDIMKRAMLTAIIICYCRPFSRNEQSSTAEATNKISLDEAEGLTDRQLALHKKLIHLRKKVVAHSEHETNPATWNAGTDNAFSYQAQEFNLIKELPNPTELESLCRKRKKQSMDLTSRLNSQLVALQNAL